MLSEFNGKQVSVLSCAQRLASLGEFTWQTVECAERLVSLHGKQWSALRVGW
jgi:hypothetical protein